MKTAPFIFVILPAARAVSGRPRLHAPSVEAAGKAESEPRTLCGRPAEVSGVITYNYVPM
jgi:hypothetical protein